MNKNTNHQLCLSKSEEVTVNTLEGCRLFCQLEQCHEGKHYWSNTDKEFEFNW